MAFTRGWCRLYGHGAIPKAIGNVSLQESKGARRQTIYLGGFSDVMPDLGPQDKRSGALNVTELGSSLGLWRHQFSGV